MADYDKTYPIIRIRCTQFEYKLFMELKEKGISARKVLENSGCPCDRCKGTDVIAFNKNGEAIKIPKGILHKKK